MARVWPDDEWNQARRCTVEGTRSRTQPEAAIKQILATTILALAVAGGAGAATGPVTDSSVGINNRSIDGWVNVTAYAGTARVLTFCVGPGKIKQEGVALHAVTRVVVEIARGSDCSARANAVVRELPVHMVTPTRALALGFVNGERGAYTVIDRL
jgi:hypothetical protein